MVSRDPQSRPTIRDVAADAGVAVGTVSNFLNNGRLVGDEKSARIAAAIARLGYRPSAVARDLSRRRSSLVGFCLPNASTPSYATLTEELERLASRDSLEMIQVLSHEDPGLELERITKLLSYGVGGVLLVPTHDAGRSLDLLAASGTPVVALNRGAASAPVDQVTIDNFRAMAELTERLIEAGYERLLFVTQYLELPITRDRIAAIEAAQRAAPGPFSAVTLEYRDAIDDIAEPFRTALRDAGDRAVIVTSSALSADWVLHELKRAGVRIPQDVSMVTFDSPDWADLLTPELAVIRQPTAQMAAVAWEMLSARIGYPSSGPRRVELATEFIPRGSLGRLQP